ncbi:relaxase/mobilization nuclease domain-containing protein [Sinomonas terrae]|uniref:Relaxase/mobilization nuclease domain-containing protein n=1 Tax=Sinomonas terrae TaxID=2908838 RepID=A0ABS9U798_9MICC|nr:relaxase/mobilization nuclease domain-containing protein [Sinomonas terrae]MCH6472597.1 relaxase/mobilization nuclease domain-containing protein [Sinomonas terrae]
MPNVTKGERMVGLINYLVGPGRANEHRDQRLVAASDIIVGAEAGQPLDAESALKLGREMDIPKAVFGAGKPGAKHVLHISLSLPADEGQLDDEAWGKIAHGFAERMGFTGADGKPPCRWIAIHHGPSKAGNDHIHLAVSMVREDGTRWSQHNDFRRAQAACAELEAEHGLRVVRGVHSERGYHPKERERANAKGAPELDRDRLQRALRAASTASMDEAEFVRRLRRTGILVRPRFAHADTATVTGYSVALRPHNKAERPVWFGGGRIARDLALPQLRKGWTSTGESIAAARAEWQAAANGKRPTTQGREARVPTAAEWEKATAEVGELFERMKAIPLNDDALWAQFARETSGAFAAWSLRTEPVPGPLAETAKALSRTAQLRGFPPRTEHAPMPSAKGAGMLLMQTAVGPSTAAGHALLLAQLRNTMRAVFDMHTAAGRLRDAERIRAAAVEKLAAVRGDLKTLKDQHQAGRFEAAPAVESEQEKVQRLLRQSFPTRPGTAAGSTPERAPGTRKLPGRGGRDQGISR